MSLYFYLENFEKIFKKKKIFPNEMKRKNWRPMRPVTLTWHLVLAGWEILHFFTISNMYIAPGHGHTGSILKLLFPLGCMFQKISLPSDFMHIFFHDFIHVYSPREWVDNPLGQSFDVNRKALLLWSFVTSFKIISSSSDLMHIFSWFYTAI